MKESVKKLEALMEIGGIKKDICFLVISGIARSEEHTSELQSH